MSKKDILIVDDEKDIRALIRGILEDEGYGVREAANAAEALEAVATKAPDLMVLDIWLQESDKDGLEILKTVKKDHKFLPVLMISGHGTIETAVTAIKHGAYDFIEKPFKSDRLLLMIARALETAALRQENQALKARYDVTGYDLIGKSAALSQLKQQIKRIAPTNSRVLITGAAGTGKEVVARMLHKLSERKENAFMALNCAALHPERLEQELFGFEKDGQRQKGVLELSNGGTVFLDEVADMPLETQGKILRALQDNRFHPVGSQEMIEVDVRILASTNKNLSEKIKSGAFREDLYYRLNVVTLHLPNLGERVEDIQPLAESFLQEFATQSGREAPSLSKPAIDVLANYNWPGNVRQLRNVMEWVMIMSLPLEGAQAQKAYKIEPENLPPEVTGISQKLEGHQREASSQGGIVNYKLQPLREAREAFERDYLLTQIKRFKGNVSQTAEFVGMERSALHRKLKSLDISLNSPQNGENEKTDNSARKAS